MECSPYHYYTFTLPLGLEREEGCGREWKRGLGPDHPALVELSIIRVGREASWTVISGIVVRGVGVVRAVLGQVILIAGGAPFGLGAKVASRAEVAGGPQDGLLPDQWHLMGSVRA